MTIIPNGQQEKYQFTSDMKYCHSSLNSDWYVNIKMQSYQLMESHDEDETV